MLIHGQHYGLVVIKYLLLTITHKGKQKLKTCEQINEHSHG